MNVSDADRTKEEDSKEDKKIVYKNRLSLKRRAFTDDTFPQADNLPHGLKILLLSHNALCTLPAVLYNKRQFGELQILDLSNNQINLLPEGVEQLQSLHSLNLNDNNLETLPDAISSLQALVKLDLRNNSISTLPDFSQICGIQIHDKKVCELHGSLKFVWISGNPIEKTINQSGLRIMVANYFSRKLKHFHLDHIDEKETFTNLSMDSNTSEPEKTKLNTELHVVASLSHLEYLGIDEPPDEIVPGLFISNQLVAEHKLVQVYLGVTHVVRVLTQPHQYYKQDISVLHLPLNDRPDVNISPHFMQAIQFIDTALSYWRENCNDNNHNNDYNKDCKTSDQIDNGSNPDNDDNEKYSVLDTPARVLVHCQAGISRSASIIFAYIMYTHKVDFKEASQFIKARHGCRPNSGFSQQLRAFYDEFCLGPG